MLLSKFYTLFLVVCLIATVPPPPPTNVSISAVGTRTATVSWQTPLVDFPNDLTAISQYFIQANPYYFDIDEVSVLTDNDKNDT